MFDFSEAKQRQLIIHRVGNKVRQEGIVLSKGVTLIQDEGIQELVLRYFLRPFRNVEAVYQFTHTSRLQLNEVYTYIDEVFSDPSQFYDQSVNIARHLYDSSTHPRIKGGEFYMIYLDNCKVNEVYMDAIGIFKTENKETYLKVVEQDQRFGIDYESGININNLDKGCIVFNLQVDSGFHVAIVDVHSKGEGEAQYWKDNFLSLQPRETSQFQTETFIDLCNQFTKHAFEDVEDKAERLQIRTKTIKYLNDNETFDFDQFANDVLQRPEGIQSFREFKSMYEEARGISTAASFTIEPKTVKKLRTKLRNFIQLDTDIEITIRNPAEEALNFVERGFDSVKGMNYYKIYFNQEK